MPLECSEPVTVYSSFKSTVKGTSSSFPSPACCLFHLLCLVLLFLSAAALLVWLSSLVAETACRDCPGDALYHFLSSAELKLLGCGSSGMRLHSLGEHVSKTS